MLKGQLQIVNTRRCSTSWLLIIAKPNFCGVECACISKCSFTQQLVGLTIAQLAQPAQHLLVDGSLPITWIIAAHSYPLCYGRRNVVVYVMKVNGRVLKNSLELRQV